MRTSRGRIATEKAFKHLGINYRGQNPMQKDIFDLQRYSQWVESEQ